MSEIVLNVIILTFKSDVAIALAFEKCFCPPYFFIFFPFSFRFSFFYFFLFSLSSPPPRPAPLRAVPVGAGSAGALLPSGGRTAPSRGWTHGWSLGSPPACCSAPPPCSLLDQKHRGFGPPAASPRGEMSGWLCPAQWHDDPVHLSRFGLGMSASRWIGGAILPPCPPPAPKGCPGTAETLGSFPAHC